MKRIRASAEQGNGDAQYRLALMFANGIATARDDAQATAWYQKAAGAGVAALVEGRAIDHPPGVLAADEPWQQLVQRPAFAHGDYELTPLADFEVEARVLSVENYSMDGGARLSPIDFALGWGPMAQPRRSTQHLCW